jgi:enamine deaminase RidA (YjgF/YER057c/UK114 family)
MDKTVVLPEWRTVASDDLDEPQSAYATVTHHDDHERVVFSGALSPEGDLAEQVRTILTHRQHALEALGGSMDDVVKMQLFVREDVLSREAQATIHEVRADFFERPHFPAATMVGVASLLDPDALVEIEIKAEIPHDEWETEILTGEE